MTIPHPALLPIFQPRALSCPVIPLHHCPGRIPCIPRSDRHVHPPSDLMAPASMSSVVRGPVGDAQPIQCWLPVLASEVLAVNHATLRRGKHKRTRAIAPLQHCLNAWRNGNRPRLVCLSRLNSPSFRIPRSPNPYLRAILIYCIPMKRDRLSNTATTTE